MQCNAYISICFTIICRNKLKILKKQFVFISGIHYSLFQIKFLLSWFSLPKNIFDLLIYRKILFQILRLFGNVTWTVTSSDGQETPEQMNELQFWRSSQNESFHIGLFIFQIVTVSTFVLR